MQIYEELFKLIKGGVAYQENDATKCCHSCQFYDCRGNFCYLFGPLQYDIIEHNCGSIRHDECVRLIGD